MSDDENDDLSTPSEDGADDALDKPASKLRGKRLIIIIIAIILLIAGIGAGLYFSGVLKGGAAKKDEHAKTDTKEGEKKPDAAPGEVFLDLEEFLVNLDAAGKQPSFLKMTVTLVLPDEAAVLEVKTKLPRIRDGFQVYLRELRIDDLQGSAGLYRLREELLLRLNKLMYPIVINDILFKSILVQ